MEKKISLEEFISKSQCTYISNELFDVGNVKAMLLEFGKQLLELAAENAEYQINPDDMGLIITISDSITNTINQVV